MKQIVATLILVSTLLPVSCSSHICPTYSRAPQHNAKGQLLVKKI